MTTKGALRGMAWDHPRARGPLEAISERWSAIHGLLVHWDARPLKDFEDQPLEELASSYDLVLIDYPFVGFAATSGLIEPVDAWVTQPYLADQAAHGVGPSFDSYAWAGRQWALAIDAACQVSALRDDLWAGTRLPAPPDDWPQVAALARALRSAPARVAMPLNDNHAYCAFLSVGVGLAGQRFWPAGARIDRAAGRDALEFLRGMAGDLHPASRSSDPIAISDRMSRSAEIAFVPLMFGYSSYARRGFRPYRLRFGNAPLGPSGRRGSVLGGVGLALSARTQERAAAADLARTIGSAETQQGLYATSGGQPGHGAAWESADVNELAGGFFAATRATIDQAFVRPRVAGHRAFQPAAGALIHRYLWSAVGSAAACLAEIDALADRWLEGWGREGVAA